MDDIAPELLEQIRADFIDAIKRRPNARELLAAIQNGNGNYKMAGQFADEIGEAMSEAFARNLSSAILPDGRMYWNIADRVVRPMLEETHTVVAEAAQLSQQAINRAAGIGIQAQAAPVDNDRIDGILNKVCAADWYDDVAWVLDEPVKLLIRAAVDETLRINAEFNTKAGVKTKIVRTATGRCCEWCRNLVGSYDYPDTPRDVFRRHSNCRCTLETDMGDGDRETLWRRGDDAQKRALAKEQKERVKKYNALSAEEKKKRDAASAARARFAAKETRLWTGTKESAILNNRKTIGLVRYEQDFLVARSVGAKAKEILVKLPDGSVTSLTQGSRVTNIQTIAGAGKKRKIDIIEQLIKEHPSSTSDLWKKKKGFGYVDVEGESYQVELHWYEEPSVGRVEWKVKPNADGNWFYD